MATHSASSIRIRHDHISRSQVIFARRRILNRERSLRAVPRPPDAQSGGR